MEDDMDVGLSVSMPFFSHAASEGFVSCTEPVGDPLFLEAALGVGDDETFCIYAKGHRERDIILLSFSLSVVTGYI